MIDHRSGRVHTSYQQAVAERAVYLLQSLICRIFQSAMKKVVKYAKPLLRDLATKSLRDYSQIELRIMAHLSQDEGLLNAFAKGLDVHRATAR